MPYVDGMFKRINVHPFNIKFFVITFGVNQFYADYILVDL